MNTRYGQAGMPKGLIGRCFGQVMAWYNQPDNTWTIELLQISGSEHLLEIGYGPGKAIQLASALCQHCKIIGIDHSETMLSAASRVNKAAIQAGTVELRTGYVEALDFSDNTFDKAFSINCIYFWPEPKRGLRELYRVIRPGGKLAITVRNRHRKAYRPYHQQNLENLMLQTGFSNVVVHHNVSASHPLLCAIATK